MNSIRRGRPTRRRKSVPNILEAANAAALKEIRERKPSQFTVGGRIQDGKLVGGITYDRTWKNGWGATAYIKAWYEDQPVSVKRAPKLEAAAEVVKRF